MRATIFASVLGLIATNLYADVVTYDCELHNLERGWISERVILSVDTENRRARALDSFIHHLDGEPKDVSFKTSGSGEYKMNWKMRVPMQQGGTAYVSYSAKLNPETKELSLLARFPQANVTNRPRGRGPCKVMRGTSLYDS